MFFGVGLNEILWLAAAIVGGGVITGLLAGLFGVGGGSVIVPVLYESFARWAWRRRCACSCASAPRLPSSCRQRSAPISPIAPGDW